PPPPPPPRPPPPPPPSVFTGAKLVGWSSISSAIRRAARHCGSAALGGVGGFRGGPWGGGDGAPSPGGGWGGGGGGGVDEPLSLRVPSGPRRPDGAQPRRGSERVPRGRATPPHR